MSDDTSTDPTTAGRPARKPKPTSAQLDVIRYFNGDTSVDMNDRRYGYRSYQICEQRGWIQAIGKYPFYRATEDGRELIAEADKATLELAVEARRLRTERDRLATLAHTAVSAYAKVRNSSRGWHFLDAAMAELSAAIQSSPATDVESASDVISLRITAALEPIPITDSGGTCEICKATVSWRELRYHDMSRAEFERVFPHLSYISGQCGGRDGGQAL